MAVVAQSQPTKEDISRIRSFLASKGLRKLVSVRKGAGSMRYNVTVQSYSVTSAQAVEIMEFLRSIGLDTGPSAISDMSQLIQNTKNHGWEVVNVAVSRWTTSN